MLRPYGIVEGWEGNNMGGGFETRPYDLWREEECGKDRLGRTWLPSSGVRGIQLKWL